MTNNQESAIACNLSVFTAAQREQHALTTKALFASVQEILDLPDGYAFRLSDEPANLRQAADFIVNERLCCPFIGFALKVEPHSSGVWLHLTGGMDVKRLLAMQFQGYLTKLFSLASGLD